MNNLGFRVFILAVLLIVVTYYIGSSTLLATLANAFQKVFYAATGRLPSGQPANYPSGATLPTGVP